VSTFNPRIVGFVCRWCSSAGADLAGTSRVKYPPNITLVKVMCSGRVDAQHVMQAFRSGADGVLVSGCHPGDCHYIKGNYSMLRRYHLLKRMLKQMGIEEGRLRLEWISATEADKLKEVVEQMVETIRGLGPLKPAREKAHAKV